MNVYIIISYWNEVSNNNIINSNLIIYISITNITIVITNLYTNQISKYITQKNVIDELLFILFNTL